MDNNAADSPPSPQTHLLHTTWMLWREGGNNRPSAETTADEWCTRLTLVTKLTSVEEFWRVYNNIQPLSVLPIGMSLNLFKKDIKPLWEDTANNEGGRWYFKLEKPRHSSDFPHYTSQIQETWLYIILSLIGNTIDDNNLICGGVVSIRARETRFMIWTRKGENPQIMDIGKSIKKNLKYCTHLSYRQHSDRRRTTKALYC